MKQGENRLSVSYDGEWIYDIVLESSYGQLLECTCSGFERPK